MSISTSDFIEQMLLFFPFKKKAYEERMQDYFEGLEIAAIEEIFMPEVIKLLKDNRDIDMLKSIFKYFEKVAVYADYDLQSTFWVAALEILGNDSSILKTAKQYMGPKTTVLQYKADKLLGRPV